MTTTTTTIEERVERGIAWLDATHPDWRDRIDTRDLDMSSACYCILGQLHEADASSHSSGYWSRQSEAWAIERGFTVSRADSYDENWGALRDAWLDALDSGARA